MAFDDWQAGRIGLLGLFLENSVKRWMDAAVAFRANTYNFDNWFGTISDQLRANWDLWNRLVPFAGDPVMPTVIIRGPHDGLNALHGEAFVSRDLTGLTSADFSASAMQDFSGTHAIVTTGGTEPFRGGPTGTFNGQVQVTMQLNAPAPGTYRGILFITEDGKLEPLVWVVLIATP